MSIFKDLWAALTWEEPKPDPNPEPPADNQVKDPPWLEWARKEIGVKEIPGPKNNSRITFYHAHATNKYNESQPWCSSFVCSALEEMGFKSTNSEWANSYATYGEKLLKPIHGCIVVFKWNSRGQGHVGFYDGTSRGVLPLLGGNQSDAVNITDYGSKKSYVVAYRWPSEFPIPTQSEKPSSKLETMYSTMTVRELWKNRAKAAADRVRVGKLRYKAVESNSGVPWEMVGIIHLLESNCSFNTHLHNGDSLQRRTVNVPSGRPKKGSPPFVWEVSALDALDYDKIKPPLNSIESILDSFERFNGLGYRNRGVSNPYLWSGSNHYTRGKYVRDGVYDPNAISEQVGAAVVLKLLREG